LNRLRRPSGYEPDELPLLYSATSGVGIEPTSKGLEALVLPLDQPDIDRLPATVMDIVKTYHPDLA